ncbi:hypothetical protein T05_7840 [Trichinella murrelli]|uniref:Uncharacterized protein n=1 Tax=Trichinella murrelli TaxID=144512 RepID=A0A0V0TJ37_9BILA|nr:hypothetical protein T05_7840 [Trichinella murrelli]
MALSLRCAPCMNLTFSERMINVDYKCAIQKQID